MHKKNPILIIICFQNRWSHDSIVETTYVLMGSPGHYQLILIFLKLSFFSSHILHDICLNKLFVIVIGGVAIIIRTKMRQYCNFVFYDDPRITGLEINCLSDSLHLLGVYLPYQCHDNYVEYKGKLSAIVERCTSSTLAII